MDEEMNTSELLVSETEQKMILKILLMAEQSENLEELKEKIKALMK